MESEAHAEINTFLEEMGDKTPDISYTGISGLLKCKSSLDPLEVNQKIKEIVKKDPWKIRYVLRLIPINIVVNTDVVDIKKAAADLSVIINKDQTFRVTVEKRRSNMKSTEIIEAVASAIERKVNLENPDWIVLVEVVGKETGISILKPSNIFSSVKEKRELP
jgi:tRNA acetyltransferase TAN1